MLEVMNVGHSFKQQCLIFKGRGTSKSAHKHTECFAIHVFLFLRYHVWFLDCIGIPQLRYQDYHSPVERNSLKAEHLGIQNGSETMCVFLDVKTFDPKFPCCAVYIMSICVYIFIYTYYVPITYIYIYHILSYILHTEHTFCRYVANLGALNANWL